MRARRCKEEEEISLGIISNNINYWEYRQVAVTYSKLPSRVAAALAWRGALSFSPFLKEEEYRE